MKQLLEDNFAAHQSLLATVMADEALKAQIGAAAEAICRCLKSGGKLLLCGNGGSAADAMHITAEFVGSFYRSKAPLAAVCLNTNTSVLTAVANDSDYRYVFSKQVQAIAQKGDMLIALTTSGKSANVLEALKAAQLAGAGTITMCGEHTEHIDSDYVIAIASSDTPRIQEMHMLIGHYFAQCAEQFFLDGEHNG